jgi:hypothetical protein
MSGAPSTMPGMNSLGMPSHLSAASTAPSAAEAAPDMSRRLIRISRRQTVMIGLMFLVGGGWVMLQKIRIPAAATAQEDQVTQNVLRLWAMEKRTETAKRQAGKGPSRKAGLWTGQYDATDRQVPRDQLRKNVFSLARQPVVAEEIPTDPVKARPDPVEPIQPEAPPVGHLHLQSVLMGDHPSAMVSGYLVRRGQVIDGWTVEQIRQNKLVLRWRDETHELTMP